MADTPARRAPPCRRTTSRVVSWRRWRQWTGGLSPQAFGGAWLNVLARLATAPGRQAELAGSALRKTLALAQFSGAALRGEAPQADGTPYAHRFADPAWSKFRST